MELLDDIRVTHQGRERRVELLTGDLAAIPPEHAVDVLVVSAFPNDYVPTTISLIGALHRAGVSVAALAERKEVDLREFSHCWLSRPVGRAGTHFRRVLCFEPSFRGQATEVVGDIFRSIVPFTAGPTPIATLAMPLVSTGLRGESPAPMLEALTDAAVHWLANGLPLDRIKIVIRDSPAADDLRAVFAEVKGRHTAPPPAPPPPRFDAFVSYAHKNKASVDRFVGELTTRRPALKLFVDRLELQPGHAWQDELDAAIKDARKVICVLTPDYLSSGMCQEELGMARLRHRVTPGGVILPLYLRSTDVSLFLQGLHYEDAREDDPVKVAAAAERMLQRL